MSSIPKYRVININLHTAGTLEFAGFAYIFTSQATDTTTWIDVQIGNRASDTIRLFNQMAVILEQPDRIFVSWVAQPNKSIVVILTISSEDFRLFSQQNLADIRSVSSVTEIVNPVRAREYELVGEGSISVGITATSIIPADVSGRQRSILIFNNSTVNVFLGGSGVTTTTGLVLPANTSLSSQRKNAIFGIIASGTADVRWSIEREVA